MTYQFSLIYPRSYPALPVRVVLQKLFIPRKWRHYLRIERAVLINQQYRYFNQKVHPGDQITLNLNHVDSHQGKYPPSGHCPQIIYEDKNVLVINKPAGQKTHPNQGERDTALNDCATYLGYSPFIVHRLDMLTSGLLLIAKNPAVVPILNRELSNKSLGREYLAKVKISRHLKRQGKITKAIGRDPLDRRKRMISPAGKKAVTYYHLISTNKEEQTACLLLKLATGRTHQIRVHLASIGCPILGDPLYNPAFKSGQKLQLRAWRLSFIAPFSFIKKQVSLPLKNKNKEHDSRL